MFAGAEGVTPYAGEVLEKTSSASKKTVITLRSIFKVPK
jgi:hypothetical protein